ncbi:DUF58 domain-containing protein [Halioxenophilus aromaticivorans]|uniref:DUF58 domain-containing protein n=1 Tax=Halioxenophilus aromaticivorans TaxID=1306992 RepID=A0AAV3U3E1_9ALTE
MRPSALLISLLGIWLGWALLIAVVAIFIGQTPLLQVVWYCFGAVIIVIAILDALRPGPLNQLTVSRVLPHSLALGVNTEVVLTLTNNLNRPLDIELVEPPSPLLTAGGFPARLSLPPGTSQKLRYQLTPIARGNTTLAGSVLRITSAWRMWQHKWVATNTNEVKVFPNFAPIAHIGQLGLEQHIRQLGVHLAQKRGEGMEFKQLRDFVEGDSMRQVDWKATARHGRPISREYQDERNQDVFFLLDCGRRLRHKQDHLSHFDHALNAILLTAYIAIRQGDGAGFQSFAGPQRWLSPVKGANGINKLLETLYDLTNTTANSDYLQAAQQFVQRHRRRSLVVLVSNVRPEDNDDLISAVQLLAKHHVVTVASLREELLTETLNQPVGNFSEALQYCATHGHTLERKAVGTNLRARGVSLIDTEPQFLHKRLVDEYFRIKRSGRL